MHSRILMAVDIIIGMVDNRHFMLSKYFKQKHFDKHLPVIYAGSSLIYEASDMCTYIYPLKVSVSSISGNQTNI